MSLRDTDQRCPPPASFLALDPTLPIDTAIERHDLCEALARQLAEAAHTYMGRDGVLFHDVLPRCRRVAESPDIGLSETEVGWVLTRVRELIRG